MTLQQMEYIVALDKYRHFVLAAEACGVTQPTLSAMIQKLEEELDVKIFNRDRKNITPTRIGEKIIRQAQIVLNETQCIKEVVADETDSMNGNLRIGILPTIAPYLVPDFIHHFRKTYPHVSLFIDEKENKSLLQELHYGNLDIILPTPPEDLNGLLEITVYTEKFVAYFSEACDQAKSCIANGIMSPTITAPINNILRAGATGADEPKGDSITRILASVIANCKAFSSRLFSKNVYNDSLILC